MSEPAVTFPKIVPGVKVLCIGRPSRRRIHDNKVPTGARIRIHDRGIDHPRDSNARDLVLGGTIHDYADKNATAGVRRCHLDDGIFVRLIRTRVCRVGGILV